MQPVVASKRVGRWAAAGGTAGPAGRRWGVVVEAAAAAAADAAGGTDGRAVGGIGARAVWLETAVRVGIAVRCCQMAAGHILAVGTAAAVWIVAVGTGHGSVELVGDSWLQIAATFCCCCCCCCCGCCLARGESQPENNLEESIESNSFYQSWPPIR